MSRMGSNFMMSWWRELVLPKIVGQNNLQGWSIVVFDSKDITLVRCAQINNYNAISLIGFNYRDCKFWNSLYLSHALFLLLRAGDSLFLVT